MIPQRILDKIEVADCWEWTAATNANGYGILTHQRRPWLAHRFVWTLLVGPIEHTLDHLCRNKLCVNPDHLEDVTALENAARGHSKWRGAPLCKNGHEFDYHNGTQRVCRTCARERQRRHRANTGV